MSEEERARRSAGAKLAKARLKADPIAYAKFKERTAKAVSQQWAGGQEQRKKNISISKKKSNALMTDEQRKQAYGWMNASHVTAEAKHAIWEKSLKKWHDEAPADVYAEMIERRTQSILESKGSLQYDNNLPEDHPINAWLLKQPNPFRFDMLFEVT
jgi:hypothetical protein